jgi:hypothetical protein
LALLLSNENQEMRHGSGPPAAWPADSPTSGATFARIDTSISCLLTRFRLRSPLLLIPFYLSFRKVRQASRRIDGLLEAVFLVEDWRTCYTLSIWRDDSAIVHFGSVREHAEAANTAFRATRNEDTGHPEIWSAQFRLWAISCHNLSWTGLDLESELGSQWLRRELVANLLNRSMGE